MASQSSSQPLAVAIARQRISLPGVMISPGLTAFDVMPVPASSLARLTARLTFADFVAEYAANDGNGIVATTLPRQMTRPHPRSLIAGVKRAIRRTIEPT